MHARTQALAVCLSMSIIFVGSMYVLVPKRIRDLPRNDSRHIRARLQSLCIATLLCGALTRHFEHGAFKMEEVMFGNVSVKTTIIPLTSYFAFFSGPVVQLIFLPDSSLTAFRLGFWMDIRNLVMAPLLEEAVFRGLMTTMAKPYFTTAEMTYGLPLFFGLAHLNHAYLLVTHEGRSVKDALLTALFQTAYTTLFGAMMMQVLLKTNNLVAVILIHAWCNFMQFPEFKALFDSDYDILARIATGFFYIVGIIVYVLDLVPQVAADVFKIRI